MSIENKLRGLCKENGEVEIESIDLTKMAVDVILPYESSSYAIELEGETDEEIIESFKEKVNGRLSDMVNHLEDCKLD
ncbi:hypothetical protein DFP94_101481 [Fontibacillus phaseoli]|uniref:Uncharacterized protein n=1 Tax=Fontibacillus phaseoli TaxID=1416533 RepID=A0A369BMR8_9BACL|nr:hypothetical protein [Fontibacillus phaseoli]RCX22892.1 hypothetical protein DFP94_101481 [Fontibacillus phaseoli]